MTKTHLAGCVTRVAGTEKVEVVSCLLSDIGLRAALRQRDFGRRLNSCGVGWQLSQRPCMMPC
jgi:hypothetical protein